MKGLNDGRLKDEERGRNQPDLRGLFCLELPVPPVPTFLPKTRHRALLSELKGFAKFPVRKSRE
jgi:hypothetical protein